jgi:hypothetical protein
MNTTTGGTYILRIRTRVLLQSLLLKVVKELADDVQQEDKSENLRSKTKIITFTGNLGLL